MQGTNPIKLANAIMGALVSRYKFPVLSLTAKITESK